MNGSTTRAKRRWRFAFRFSLRSLVMLLIAAAIGLGVFSWGLRRARRQAPAVAALRQLGATIHYDYGGVYPGIINAPNRQLTKPSPYPSWLVTRLGIDFFHDVIEVHCEQSRFLSEHEQDRFWRAIDDLPQLERLEASGGLTRPGSILRLKRHHCLESLALRWADIAPDDYAVLSTLRRLATLNLSDTPVTDEGLERVARIRTLKCLDLHDTEITDKGIEHLARMPRLERLWLSCTDVGDAGIAHLHGHPAILDLDLGYTAITDASLGQLASIPQLAELDLTATAVTDRGLAFLEGHRKLSYLNLESSEVRGAGLASLKRLPNLKELCLGGRGRIESLVSLAGCTRLERLSLNCGIPLIDQVDHIDIPQGVIEIDFSGGEISEHSLVLLAATSKIKVIRFAGLGYDVQAETLNRFLMMQPQCQLVAKSFGRGRGLRERP